MMFIIERPKNFHNIESRTLTDGSRWYITPNGDELPSVTTVLSILSKGFITKWKEKVGTEEAERISKQAICRGNELHSLCESYLKNEKIGPLLPTSQELFQSVKPYLNRIGTIHLLEDTLWSNTLGMAGRTDVIAEFDGVLSVIDFKSASKPKKEEWIQNYFLQTTAYSLMHTERYGEPVKQVVVIIAIEDEFPQIFIKKPKNYIPDLIKVIKQYKESGLV
jgi:ATP-dependent exoDNAse (exonuclease V) beta subunit